MGKFYRAGDKLAEKVAREISENIRKDGIEKKKGI